ncbi:hypothetical protein Dsin_005267 [Dipteronia sinensis]|uniref:DUF4283 domain-containing protein n=1 Tax=Dipteronia sinensis TaxID=43782 RepID=A0AAE0AX46_9ROSI|nr:hypothetical protein Dsin_005267 [Dipteronia sinensis]
MGRNKVFDFIHSPKPIDKHRPTSSTSRKTKTNRLKPLGVMGTKKLIQDRGVDLCEGSYIHHIKLERQWARGRCLGDFSGFGFGSLSKFRAYSPRWNALIGRLVLSSGEWPWKLVDLKLDKATSDGDFSHYARVLVYVDVSAVLPTSVLLERDGFHSSFIVVEYENLPAFCSTCSSIGHLPRFCRWNKSSKVPLTSSVKLT